MGMAGAYQSRKGKRGIVIEAVCDEDLWVWHLFVGAPGSMNDINVMIQSPLYLDITVRLWPQRNHPYTINGNTRRLPCYLVDGIYLRFPAVFDAWAQAQNSAECESLRDTLTADIYRDRGELLATYIR
eukprot:TRINITY_DN8935_c0_g1_i1.p1 TRINITY_DN8935_c0_g1~~TRINITY_DN8935_c0_g1_i1.p1  ORF type:complete len:128 (-),score=14.30 TRINITY_DN8935_c0_g1_i1:100-483(-)